MRKVITLWYLLVAMVGIGSYGTDLTLQREVGIDLGNQIGTVLSKYLKQSGNGQYLMVHNRKTLHVFDLNGEQIAQYSHPDSNFLVVGFEYISSIKKFLISFVKYTEAETHEFDSLAFDIPVEYSQKQRNDDIKFSSKFVKVVVEKNGKNQPAYFRDFIDSKDKIIVNKASDEEVKIGSKVLRLIKMIKHKSDTYKIIELGNSFHTQYEKESRFNYSYKLRWVVDTGKDIFVADELSTDIIKYSIPHKGITPVYDSNGPIPLKWESFIAPGSYPDGLLKGESPLASYYFFSRVTGFKPILRDYFLISIESPNEAYFFGENKDQNEIFLLDLLITDHHGNVQVQFESMTNSHFWGCSEDKVFIFKENQINQERSLCIYKVN